MFDKSDFCFFLVCWWGGGVNDFPLRLLWIRICGVGKLANNRTERKRILYSVANTSVNCELISE